MKSKIREFIKSVKKGDNSKIKQTLKEVLKEKVVNRLKQSTEE